MISLSSIAGQTSSIDILIQQYMALERRPILDLQNQISSLNTKIGIYNDLKSQLKALQSAAKDLADTTNSSIYNAVKVTSSDTDALTVTASSGAAQGQYIFRIRQLATATQVKSTAELNTHSSTISTEQVVAGSEGIDTSKSWEEAGFENTTDILTGRIEINNESFTLSDYETVDDFMDAVNNNASANANIYYDNEKDKFVIEKTTGGDLRLEEFSGNRFFDEVNITIPPGGKISTNATGLQSDAYLYQINFDDGVSQSDSGSFKINNVTIEWDADTDTLDSLISKINSSDAGVTAYYDDSIDKLVMTSDTPGNEPIQMSDETGTLLDDTLKIENATQTLGQEAKFTINSTDSADEITKSSNTFTINGLTFTLNKVTVANDSYTDADTTSVTVDSTKDQTALEGEINTFLTSYNSFVDYMKEKTRVDVTTYYRGALAGDTLFSGMKSSVLGILLGEVSGIESDKPSYLSEIGITVDDNLHASISDSSALSDWLSQDPSAVENLFNSTSGVATRMVELLEPYTENYGIVDDQKDNIGDQIELMEKRIASLEVRMERREAYYRQQFSALQNSLTMVNYQQSILSNLTNTLNSFFNLS